MSVKTRLAKRHEILLYLTSLVAAMSVMGEMNLLMRVVFFVGIVASIVMSRYDLGAKVPTNVWNVFILVALALTAARMFLSDEESILVGGVRFILLLLLLKLMSRRGGERDDWQIYALSLLLMSAGTAVNEDIAYGLIFAIYLMLSTYGLTVFHLSAEQFRHKPGAKRVDLNRFYKLAFGGLALTIFASSVALFFLFPRVGLGFFAQKSREQTSMIGFSDEVSLGGHGVIRDNPEVAMRVYFPDNKMPPEAQSWHWRMMSFDDYDGVKWLRNKKARPQNTRRRNTQKHQYDLLPLWPKPLTEHLSKQDPTVLRVYMEPMDVDQAPSLWMTPGYRLPKSLAITFNPARAFLRYDAHFDDLYISQKNDLGVLFEMEVLPAPKLPGLSSLGDYSSREMIQTKAFRGLPKEGMEQIVALGQKITKGIKSPHDQAKAVEMYLQKNYSYTTNLPPVNPQAPVQDFLFRTKRGHCEFFATSMVLLLRANGVGARIVNGFLGGSWNNVGKYMAVRQGDAHSWVEVYLPKYGWHPFDPTPASDVLPVKPDPTTAWLNHTYDAARMAWVNLVIEYDLDKQLEAVRRVSQILSPSGKPLFGEKKEDQKKEEETSSTQIPWKQIIIWGVFLGLCVLCYRSTRTVTRRSKSKSLIPPLALGLIGVFAALGSAWMGWYHLWRPSMIGMGVLGPVLVGCVALLRHAPDSATKGKRGAEVMFGKFEKILRAKGIERASDEGPQAFIVRASMIYPEASNAMQAFGRLYLVARFGHGRLTESELQELSKHLTQIKTNLSRSS